ncbi:MAG: NAD(P)H-dependent oxidoreductase subunit E [Lachnospiraceae bacterium]|nr:NAD(P)H-dependent oxidoreductase subunit E [Lachnospiraceae bacterium]
MNEQEKQLEEIFSYYDKAEKPAQQDEIISLLRELQELCGFISPEAKRRAADTLDVKETVLTCLIRRFPSLKEADYQHTVTVCTGERCGKKQSMEVLRAVKQELQIDEKTVPGKPMLSKNGRILLKTQNCLKQCRTAPNLMIDGEIYRQVKPEDVPELLSKGWNKR